MLNSISKLKQKNFMTKKEISKASIDELEKQIELSEKLIEHLKKVSISGQNILTKAQLESDKKAIVKNEQLVFLCKMEITKRLP